MLDVSHLHKKFTSVTAVDDVSFSVHQGQVFGLIGPNGAGKSTTIRMIMDIIQPDAGEVRIDGARLNEKAKDLIGYLPEERGLYRKNRLMNVIAYFGALKGLRPAEARRAADPLLEHFSLSDYRNRNVEELSKGNQQKVQFIISVLHQPRLLVLDELFSGLDPVNQQLMKDALLRLKAENRAIIFSTHQMEQAEKLCDELLMIDHGRTVLHGTPAEIKRVHGRSALQVECSGDTSAFRAIPGIRVTDLAQNYAELELEDGSSTNDVIAAMLPLVDIHRVARIEPSLHAIFLEVAGRGADAGAAEQNGATGPPPTRLTSRDPRVRKEFMNMLIFLVVSVVLAGNFRNDFDAIGGAFILASIGLAGRAFLRFRRFRRELLEQDAEGPVAGQKEDAR